MKEFVANLRKAVTNPNDWDIPGLLTDAAMLLESVVQPPIGLVQAHPLPWDVHYGRPPGSTWDANTSPRVVDANDDLVFVLPQHVEHPGVYDSVADALAVWIVDCANLLEDTPRVRL